MCHGPERSDGGGRSTYDRKYSPTQKRATPQSVGGQVLFHGQGRVMLAFLGAPLWELDLTKPQYCYRFRRR